MSTLPVLRASAAALLAAFVATACASTSQVRPSDNSPPSTPPRAAATTWTEVAAWPFAPWWHHIGVWTGGELLVFGAPPGRQENAAAPPGVGRAAGAYNPATNQWRPIANAPFDLQSAASLGVPTGAYVMVSDYDNQSVSAELWTYSVAEDAWRQIPVPRSVYPGELALAGETLTVTEYGAGQVGTPVHLLDLETERWREAPADPWPASEAHAVTGLPDGRLVLLETPGGTLATPPPDLSGSPSGISVFVEEGEPRSPKKPGPCWQGAVLEPGATRWRELPSSGITLELIGRWYRVGDHLVNLQEGALPAGSVVAGCATGTEVPLGGALDLNTGRWEPLADVPADYAIDMNEIPLGHGPLAVVGSLAYDPAARTWMTLPALPRGRVEYASSIRIWAGNQLLMFANALYRETKSGLRTTRVHDGWSWTADR